MKIEKKYTYEYPNDLDLNPDSELHKKLLEAVQDRVRRGYNVGSDMRKIWRKLDHLQTAYVPTTSDSIFELSKNPKAPVDVVIPMSRACLDSFVSYMGGVFLTDPTGIYGLKSNGSKESLLRTAKMDRLMNTQAVWFQHTLKHFVGFRDAFLYGISAKVPVWTKHKRRESVVEQVSELLYELIRQEIPGIKPGDLIRYLEERVYHEGSAIHNVDPYALILDPNMSLNEYQDSEFLGYFRRTNAMNLLQQESDPEEKLFNCKYARDLAKTNAHSTENWRTEHGRKDRETESEDYYNDSYGTQWNDPNSHTTTEVDIAHLYWKLIPKEWDLGDSEYPELWEIAMAGNEIIVRCNCLDYDHGRFPIVLSGPTTCGYDIFPISGLAATYGMQQLMDWKVRAHWWNASKVANDMFVVDGSGVEIEDFRHPSPGKIIRLKRPLFGTSSIDQFIKQLHTVDVTANYIADINGVNDLLNRVLGTQDILAGNMSQMPERPTAAGLQSAHSGAFARMQMYAQIITDQEWYTLIEQMAHNNIQYMENDTVVSIVGSRFEQALRDELGISGDVISISPWDLSMDFDIIPINRMQKDMDLSAMNMLMDRILAVPEIAMTAFGGVDVRRMLLTMVRKMGFADIHEYVQSGNALPPINAQVMPDEQIMQQEQAGNLMPVEGVSA